jgi:hypothetical protein
MNTKLSVQRETIMVLVLMMAMVVCLERVKRGRERIEGDGFGLESQ